MPKSCCTSCGPIKGKISKPIERSLIKTRTYQHRGDLFRRSRYPFANLADPPSNKWQAEACIGREGGPARCVKIGKRRPLTDLHCEFW